MNQYKVNNVLFHTIRLCIWSCFCIHIMSWCTITVIKQTIKLPVMQMLLTRSNTLLLYCISHKTEWHDTEAGNVRNVSWLSSRSCVRNYHANTYCVVTCNLCSWIMQIRPLIFCTFHVCGNDIDKCLAVSLDMLSMWE